MNKISYNAPVVLTFTLAAFAALVLNTVIKLMKTSVVDKLTLCIFIAVLLLAVVFSVSPIVFVLAAALCGVAVKVWKEAAKK